ncbi:MAG: glycosyltransferase [Sphingobacteriales bacterium]|nr:MAG: glycosyltransferase [Sphingobacteriales bacterium]
MEASDNHLHIISFNVPWPADYGGVIDVFYKIKALAEAGVKVHLHCYQYGRSVAKELDKYCHKVYYYKRRIFRDPIFSKLPYIVGSRNTSALLENLLQDNYPILFEGMHCCYYLAHPALAERYKVVRMHNIEHTYYRSLAKVEKNPFKKYFFEKEAARLKKFESVLNHANAIAAISPADTELLASKYKNVFYLPVFHAHDEVKAIPGKGKFALYHGNLGVGENNEAALFLVKEVFSKSEYPLVIAGNNPSPELVKAAEENKNIEIRTKITTEEIDELIRKAHVNVLPTFQSTGMKLKLINVLFQGRHILANSKMVHNTGVEELCAVVNTPEQFRQAIKDLDKINFTEKMAWNRQLLLQDYFINYRNIQLLTQKIFSPVR